MLCQACSLRPVEIIERCDDELQPYELCKECHNRLLLYSLRPIEWYNLASIHTFYKFLLYDDFYEDDGVATQPEEDVDESKEFAAPTLDDVKGNIELLIDYCIAKWWLKEDMIDCLRSFEPQVLLMSITNRFKKCNSYYVKSRLYEVAAKALGKFSEDWIREQWKSYDDEHIIELSEAAALCLPFEEGYSLVKSALDSIPDSKLPNIAFACLHTFRSPLVLDWIETKVNSPVKDSWGRLAAASHPSWYKISEWLQKGRPYSLVAIDTLIRLIPHQGEVVLKRLDPRPTLINPSSVELMSQVLKEYSEKDNTARVRQGIERILDHWNIIIGR